MSTSSATKQINRQRRHNRVRAKVVGTEERPRLAVFRSNKYLYAQIIDDTKRVTILGVDSRKVTGNAGGRAEALGEMVALEAKKKGVTKVVFDRGGFLYTGSIQKFADSARKGGLEF